MSQKDTLAQNKFNMTEPAYTYRATVTGVYDGDTITVDLDLGLNTWLHSQTIRLARINAAELKGSNKLKGQAARDWLRRRLLNQSIIVQTIKDKKEIYGRWLGEVWQAGVNLNDEMLSKGIALPYED